MARSRTPWAFFASGALRRASTSSTVRNLGRASQVEGVVSRAEGSFLRKPLRTRNLKKDRRAEMSRARDRAERPAWLCLPDEAGQDLLGDAGEGHPAGLEVAGELADVALVGLDGVAATGLSRRSGTRGRAGGRPRARKRGDFMSGRDWRRAPARPSSTARGRAGRRSPRAGSGCAPGSTARGPSRSRPAGRSGRRRRRRACRRRRGAPPWTKPTLPGVCPGMWMTRSEVRPMAISSPSARRRSGGGEFRAPRSRLSSM